MENWFTIHEKYIKWFLCIRIQDKNVSQIHFLKQYFITTVIFLLLYYPILKQTKILLNLKAPLSPQLARPVTTCYKNTCEHMGESDTVFPWLKLIEVANCCVVRNFLSES